MRERGTSTKLPLREQVSTKSNAEQLAKRKEENIKMGRENRRCNLAESIRERKIKDFVQKFNENTGCPATL